MQNCLHAAPETFGHVWTIAGGQVILDLRVALAQWGLGEGSSAVLGGETAACHRGEIPERGSHAQQAA